jgi:hypothetical protein
MHTTGTHSTVLADLGNLAAELTAHGLQATLESPGNGTPCLLVRNPRASILTETVHACDDSYYWSWHEPIAPRGQAATAAAILARVLRTVDAE